MRVLILESDAHVSRGLARTLRVLGHEPLCPASATEARAWLEGGAPVEAVIASQQQEAGEDGAAFLAWVEARRPAVRRILTSIPPCPSGFVERPGVQSFQAKPFGREELEALLGPALGRGGEAP